MQKSGVKWSKTAIVALLRKSKSFQPSLYLTFRFIFQILSPGGKRGTVINKNRTMGSVLVHPVCYNKMSETGWLVNSSGGWKSKIKVPG